MLANKDSIGFTPITLRSSSLFSQDIEEHALTNQSRLAHILAVLYLHLSVEILIAFRESLISIYGVIDLIFK